MSGNESIPGIESLSVETGGKSENEFQQIKGSETAAELIVGGFNPRPATVHRLGPFAAIAVFLILAICGHFLPSPAQPWVGIVLASGVLLWLTHKFCPSATDLMERLGRVLDNLIEENCPHAVSPAARKIVGGCSLVLLATLSDLSALVPLAIGIACGYAARKEPAKSRNQRAFLVLSLVFAGYALIFSTALINRLIAGFAGLAILSGAIKPFGVRTRSRTWLRTTIHRVIQRRLNHQPTKSL